jgi:hypothetical protein
LLTVNSSRTILNSDNNFRNEIIRRSFSNHSKATNFSPKNEFESSISNQNSFIQTKNEIITLKIPETNEFIKNEQKINIFP